jgi:hypothetical protein
MKDKFETPSNTRVFNLKDQQGNVDYTVIHEEFEKHVSQTTLYRSMDKLWSDPGEKLLQLRNDGNGFVMSYRHASFPKLSKKKIELPYNSWAELFLLMKTVNVVDPVYMGSVTEEIFTEKI